MSSFLSKKMPLFSFKDENLSNDSQEKRLVSNYEAVLSGFMIYAQEYMIFFDKEQDEVEIVFICQVNADLFYF